MTSPQETKHIEEAASKPAVPHDGTLQAGTVLHGRYRIQGLLGVGGMGAVYQARDMNFPEVTKLCAVKEMINLQTDPAMREQTIRNFQREANILATLSHPAIPEIYDFFNEGDRTYLIMEYIKGKDMEAILNSTDDKFLPIGQVREWAIEICDVLHYLHQNEPEPVVFRDMKPSNVMIDQHRHVRLIDFGIAKHFQVDQKHTMIGTEGYSPPEQYRGEVSPQSDVYALGATMHHLLTRRDPRLEPPFSFESRPIQEFNPDVPDDMVAVINRALAYEPSERYATALEMKQALEALGGGSLAMVAGVGLSMPGGVGSAGSAQVVSTFLDSSGQVLPVWTFEVEDEIRSTPCADRDAVYVGAYDNNLWALDAKEGSLLWKFATEGGIGSSPTVQAGYVFVGSEDRTLYAIDARSGRIQWTYISEGKIFTTPRAVLGHVFFGSDDSKLYAVKAGNGRLAWTFEAAGRVRSSAAITDEMIYFGCESGDVYGLDLSGEMKWRFKARRAVTSSPLVHDGIVYFGSNDGTVYAVDAETGFTIWRFRTKKPVVSSPAWANRKLYIGSADGHLYAIDPLGGRELWKYETGGQVTSSPLVYESIVYFGSIDGSVYALNAETGDLVWQFATGGPVTSSPTTEGGLIYFGSYDHRLYALKA